MLEKEPGGTGYVRTCTYTDAFTEGSSEMPWDELVQVDPGIEGLLRLLLQTALNSINNYAESPSIGKALCVDTTVAALAQDLQALNRGASLSPERTMQVHLSLGRAPAQARKSKRGANAGTEATATAKATG